MANIVGVGSSGGGGAVAIGQNMRRGSIRKGRRIGRTGMQRNDGNSDRKKALVVASCNVNKNNATIIFIFGFIFDQIIITRCKAKRMSEYSIFIDIN